jgi:transposase
MELPSVHVPSEKSREKKSMCAAREMLVKMRTSAVNAVRGYMHTQLMALGDERIEHAPHECGPPTDLPMRHERG